MYLNNAEDLLLDNIEDLLCDITEDFLLNAIEDFLDFIEDCVFDLDEDERNRLRFIGSSTKTLVSKYKFSVGNIQSVVNPTLEARSTRLR